MTIRTHLLGGSAAILVSFAGAAWAETHPMTGEELAADQTFVYRVLDEHSSVDPGVVEDVSGSELVRDLFEGLMNQDEDGNLEPGVATGFDVSDDGMTYTFHLRPEAMWSNGDPVVAGDFVYAWRRAASPELASPYAWYIELMSIENGAAVIAGDMMGEDLGVAAPDDHTFVVTLTAPLPYFAQMTTHGTTFPVHQATVEEFGDAWTRPENMVSNGAYILTEHVPQERSVRERNELYWDNEHTIIDKVVALVINDENVALTRWKAGELDRTEVPAGQFPSLMAEYPDETISFPRLCSYYYNFNLGPNGPEFLQDVRVRQALSLAVDRSIITEAVLAGGQWEAYTFTPAATAGFTVPDVEIAGMTQDERNARAVELMAEAGYGPDNPLSVDVLYNTSEAHQSIAVAISQMWKQTLGVETTLANQEWQTFLEARGNGDYQISRAGWCGDYNEASTFLDLMQSNSGYNDSKYNNPEVDQMLSDAKVSDDPQALYTAVEDAIAADVPILPIYHYAGNYMMDSDVGNWPTANVQQNWYSRNLYMLAE
ncbi:MAG: peptide ABC transporter substrate-binding protein [Rhodobacteraceae bacterium]|nr:peptide ABC transporter substrate-binding protein [Paracoccaceae bacterium]